MIMMINVNAAPVTNPAFLSPRPWPRPRDSKMDQVCDEKAT